MLTLEHASFRHAGAAADCLHEVTLSLPDGTVTGLVGGAESGASTLCLVLAGLAPRVIGGQLRGRLLINGADATEWPIHRLAEIVVLGLQDPAGQLSMIAETVIEEVAFGPANLGLARDDILERVDESLQRLGIADLATRDPRKLSGGQQQLVVIAGLLAMRPSHLVLDEPLAHLDRRGGERVLTTLADLAGQGTAILVAEKRTAALLEVCDRVVAIDAGRVVAEGSPAAILGAPEVLALGVEEPAIARLGRLLREAGAEPRHPDAGRDPGAVG